MSNYSDLIKWQLQLLLINKVSVTELYNDMKKEYNDLFHLSTLTRFLNEGKISHRNLEKVNFYLEKTLKYNRILELFFSQFPSHLPIRKLILNLFNNPETLEIISYTLSKEIMSKLKINQETVDYLLTFPDAVPMASLLGPKYLNIPYISLLTYKPTLEPSLSVDYRIENEIIRSYYIPTNDVIQNKSFGIILDYIEFGNLRKIFFELIQKPEIRGEIKFLVVIVSVGNTQLIMNDLDDLDTYILYNLN
ncbi:MAG: hypothetical protein ACW967_01370 [Candidatus Hodarchaeales archaeon]|jgi:hypothetical protein